MSIYFGSVSGVGGVWPAAQSYTGGFSGAARSGAQGGAEQAERLPGNMLKSNSTRNELRDQLRELKEEKRAGQQQNPFAVTTGDMVSALAGETDKKDSDDLVGKSSSNYNFREVTNKIQSAKTSASAGKAVLSAKRKVQELKRKIANSDGDSEELELALNHAKRIERTAKKKQRHLEMEELIARTQGRDERRDKAEESMQDAQAVQRQKLEDELSDKQADLDERETEMFSEAMAEMRKRSSEISDEMIAAADEMIASVNEEERAMLEQMEELLENMEILDPHMSEEELEKVKARHRSSENKEIVKADADYWKGMMKHNADRLAAGGAAGFGGSSGASMTAPSFDVSVSSVSAPSAATLAMASFDAQA